jgi:D-amino-acid dehydrogenase
VDNRTLTLEPALAPIADKLAGSIHYATDETGGAHRFCDALAKSAQQRGVTLPPAARRH